MKLGLSSYSFRPILADGSLTIEGLFDWLKAQGAEHLEIATFSFAEAGKEKGYDLSVEHEAIARIEAAVARTGVPVSGLCMAASFISPGERQGQIDMVKRHVDLCKRLGAPFLRHDVVPWAYRLTDTAEFELEFPGIVSACREIAEYGATQGVVTSVEDHGFFMNSSERIRRLLHAVDHPNFRLTVDVGNFLCVDDEPHVATKACLPYASFVHVKDFYVRGFEPGPGWLETYGGQYIRGSIFGFGDLDTHALLESVVASGYDGFVSLEYEGGEPSLQGCEIGLNNLRRMLDEVRG
ncbi:MAG: sugar phosphate isomerase/epimerase [Candidatus Devosia phytovorans]|uniref:Sugar phosphate isomerase/epimerase n=1 Tax=Candidatus Devosia phytovorans TaxID=3121372 RepID=A0AAJ5VUB6_9HYPH|nr:sugar phosphate isomerase/epimerase family protein [Devosia sp.]WEK04934.1 MAG: sugar phosphate isomerase/epimerase [Devosia sp.]